MAELRRPALRLGLGLAIVILALVDVQGLVQTLRSQARMRERVLRATRDNVLAARPRLGALLRSGGEAALRAAAEEVLQHSLASEFEVFDRQGRRLFAHPAQAPVEHWLEPLDFATVLSGGAVTRGPVAGESSRLLSYLSLRSGEEVVIVRLSVPTPEMVEDLRERRALLVGHALSLAVLVVAGALAFFPRGEASTTTPQALDAYEEAMGRLRDRGFALEQRIREREPMARAGELTAGMAHEIRNGLGTILGYARLLERGAVPAEAIEAGRTIREECESLEGVIRRFVEFVKEDNLKLTPFDPARMLARVVARELRHRPGAAVVCGEAGAGLVVGDEELLERAFENLIRNARDAAGPGGRVTVEGSLETEQVRVTIADDGPGLDPEARSRLRPFYTTKPGGLGLGLPLVYKIIGLHRGELRMGERSPHGLEVVVRLPISGPTS